METNLGRYYDLRPVRGRGALAVAVDRWREDATDGAETAVIKAHEAYRKLIRAPKREEAA